MSGAKQAGISMPTQFTTWVTPAARSVSRLRATAPPPTQSPGATCGGGQGLTCTVAAVDSPETTTPPDKWICRKKTLPRSPRWRPGSFISVQPRYDYLKQFLFKRLRRKQRICGILVEKTTSMDVHVVLVVCRVKRSWQWLGFALTTLPLQLRTSGLEPISVCHLNLGSPHAMQARQRGLGDTHLWASPGSRQGAVGYHSHCGAGLQVCEVQAQTSTQRLGPVHTQTFGL